jgi:hypothetical protein
MDLSVDAAPARGAEVLATKEKIKAGAGLREGNPILEPAG